MADLWQRLPDGAGMRVNRKDLQNFIKALLFEKPWAEVKEKAEADYAQMTGAALAIVQTVSEAGSGGDFSKLKPLIDFAFTKDGMAKTGKRKGA